MLSFASGTKGREETSQGGGGPSEVQHLEEDDATVVDTHQGTTVTISDSSSHLATAPGPSTAPPPKAGSVASPQPPVNVQRTRPASNYINRRRRTVLRTTPAAIIGENEVLQPNEPLVVLNEEDGHIESQISGTAQPRIAEINAVARQHHSVVSCAQPPTEERWETEPHTREREDIEATRQREREERKAERERQREEWEASQQRKKEKCQREEREAIQERWKDECEREEREVIQQPKKEKREREESEVNRQQEREKRQYEKREPNRQRGRKELEDKEIRYSKGAIQTIVNGAVEMARIGAKDEYDKRQIELMNQRLPQNTQQLAIDAEAREREYQAIRDHEMQLRQPLYATRQQRAATIQEIEITEPSHADVTEEIEVTDPSQADMTDQSQPLDSIHQQQAAATPETEVTEPSRADVTPSFAGSNLSRYSSLPFEMSITLLDCKDAIALVGTNAQRLALKITYNFFDVFGTTGCRLNCQEKRTVDQNFQYNRAKHVTHSRKERKWVRATRKKHFEQSSGSHHEWFTASNIAESSVQGCGSCSILRIIIQNLFSGTEQGLSGRYEYSHGNFEIKRRPFQGSKEPVERIQLFQPPGSSIQFQQLYQSNFLYNRETSIIRLRGWVEECLRSHKKCSKYNIAQNDSTRPARLLDLIPIQRHGESGIRLIETASGSSYEYACLSHRWDSAVEQHKTTLATLSKFLDFLNLKDLPANFRDAVSIARELNIPYLWIDSLCIIQCGHNGKDLYQELAKMGSIYQNAHLTIAAVSSPNSAGGCFMKDKWPDICFSVSKNTNEAHLIGARVLDKKGYKVSANVVNDRFPLLGRAWVFQERLLSPRLLQCNYGEFVFECLESSQCECKSVLAPHPAQAGWVPTGVGLSFTHRQRLHADDEGTRGSLRSNGLEYWKAIVKEYMKLELSDPSDVLPAIAGCAQALALHLGFKYIAGMWKETLKTELLWYVEPQSRGAVPKPRPIGSTAPSWSWASVSMRQTIGHIAWRRSDWWLKSDVLLENAIKEVHCEPESAANPFGKLKDAYLKLDAVLYPWYLRLFCWEIGQEDKLKWNKDLYIERPNRSNKCTTTKTRELAVNGAKVALHVDVRFKEEGMVMETFSHCIGSPTHPCALTQISLLHALHKETPPRSLDVFLLLKRVPPANGKPNCYRRIGLMEMINDQADVQTWEQMIQGRLEPRREEFWLF